MNRKLLSRLLLDGAAFALFLFGFSYWWWGNLPHEVAGSAFFVLLVGHNLLQRRWYRALPRTRPQPIDRFNVLLTGILLLAMLTLLATSVLISETVFAALGLAGGVTARQLHILAAYWALVIVSIHLGLRWPLLMNAARGALGLARGSVARRWALRAAAAAIAWCGVQASFELGLGARLAAEPQLALWDFNESVAGFFARCLAVAGLYVALTHCVLEVVRRREPAVRRRDRAPEAQETRQALPGKPTP